MPATPRARAARANLLKQQLIEHLGGQCDECGSTEQLEINHIYGRDYKANRISHYRRVLRYWREARQEPPLVNLLCAACNKAYRPLPMPTAEQVEAAPF